MRRKGEALKAGLPDTTREEATKFVSGGVG